MKLTFLLFLFGLAMYNLVFNDVYIRLLNRPKSNSIVENKEQNLIENRCVSLREKREIKANMETLTQNGSESESSKELERRREKMELLESFKRAWPVEMWKERGFFTEEYLELINEHWLQFPPPSAGLQKTLGGLYLLFSTVGCWGNVIVLFMYFKANLLKRYMKQLYSGDGLNDNDSEKQDLVQIDDLGPDIMREEFDIAIQSLKNGEAKPPVLTKFV